MLCCVYAGTTPASGAPDAFFFHIAARRAKKMAAASRVTPASAPMTIPAMAPPESFEPESEDDEFGEFDPEAVPVDVGVDEASADAGDVDDPVVAVLEPVAELRVVGLLVAELTILDSVPPRTCASRTTPTLDVQQLLESPQHQRSLVAVPSQGTMGVLPNVFFVSWQTSRQPPPETSLLVQKSTHYTC